MISRKNPGIIVGVIVDAILSDGDLIKRQALMGIRIRQKAL